MEYSKDIVLGVKFFNGEDKLEKKIEMTMRIIRTIKLEKIKY